MRGVEDTSPKNPDALPFDIEETPHFEPPGVGLSGQKRQAWASQIFEAHREGCGILLRRQDRGGFGFRRTDKFGEEAALGKQLVAKDFERRTGTGMWAESKIGW